MDRVETILTVGNTKRQQRVACSTTLVVALSLLLAMACSVTLKLFADEPLPEVIDFSRDIRPILSDTCFKCHGPDESTREADFRLDTKAGAFTDLGGYRAIDPGKLETSELYRRITTDDAERMPPDNAERKLSARQIELLGRWIEQGAVWQKHWSLVAPTRPPLPEVNNPQWATNPIDFFVLDRLQRDGISPEPLADRETLIRRVTLDITGIPPTPEEIDTFLLDNSPSAFERVVDRLLASPRYGERMAVPWLDAARYADTSGYQTDGERFMWRWRDWVIEAFNSNMPYDQFTIEQLAGDLLPSATIEQRIATGFNRNHRGNAEGGIIPEEYLVEYVVDRVDTTATVWLGLTMGCARCHDHKYDPIKQKEFYQVFAFFNNIPERGKAFKFGNAEPSMKAPTRSQQAELKRIDKRLAQAHAKFAELSGEITAAQARWEENFSSTASSATSFPAEPIAWPFDARLLARFHLDGAIDNSAPPRAQDEKKDDAADSEPENKPELPGFRGGKASFGEGRFGKAIELDGNRHLEVGDAGGLRYLDEFSIGAWIRPASDAGGGILSKNGDDPRSGGYSLSLEGGKVQANFVSRWLDDCVRVETIEKLQPHRWHHVMVTYNGSRRARGIRIYVNGKSQPLNVHVDDLNQHFRNSRPLRIGSQGNSNRFHGSIDDVRIYLETLNATKVALLATMDSVDAILSTPPKQRTEVQQSKLASYFVENHLPANIDQARREVATLIEKRKKLIVTFPSTMVMEERESRRDTFVLTRGEYDKPGEKVEPGVPSSLPPLPVAAPKNRLGFAQWLVNGSNPLTARVAVNRYWQMYFGAGIVRTVEDLGSQGERPSHPRLLDWLATEFVRTGWDIKALQKLIVTSATYRQSSNINAEKLAKDPNNQLFSRGPRVRLSAEMIRDQALFVSGLFVETLGGPSVNPYQPDGRWKELSGHVYGRDSGASLYRRSMYTFFKRTIAPPSMMNFDAAGREACVVRATRTNTPLQALNLMNDVTYVEAARVLAERVMKEAGPTPSERVSHAFRLATARRPTAEELRILVDGFEAHLSVYRNKPEAATDLVATGEAPRDESLPSDELAAYTNVTNLILNLDEVITKG